MLPENDVLQQHLKQKKLWRSIMSHSVNTENLFENYQIYKVLDYAVGKKYFQIRDVTVAPSFFWEDANLIKHNNMSIFSTREDAKKALNEIINENLRKRLPKNDK